MLGKWKYAIFCIVEVSWEGWGRRWNFGADDVFMKKRKGEFEPSREYAVIDAGFGRSIFEGYFGLSVPMFVFAYKFVELYHASAAFEIPYVFAGCTRYGMNDSMYERAQFGGDVQPAGTAANDEDNITYILWTSVVGRVRCHCRLKPPIEP